MFNLANKFSLFLCCGFVIQLIQIEVMKFASQPICGFLTAPHSFRKRTSQINCRNFFSIYLPERDTRLSWPRWLVTYRRSPIQLVTHPAMHGVKLAICWSRVRRPAHYTTKPPVFSMTLRLDLEVVVKRMAIELWKSCSSIHLTVRPTAFAIARSYSCQRPMTVQPITTRMTHRSMLNQSFLNLHCWIVICSIRNRLQWEAMSKLGTYNRTCSQAALFFVLSLPPPKKKSLINIHCSQMSFYNRYRPIFYYKNRTWSTYK